MRRKKWNTPQLVILVRGRPEEQVLANCKTTRRGGPYSAFQMYCGNASGPGGEGPCGGTCKAVGTS